QNDQNLRALEHAFNVQVFGRAHVLSVRGAPSKVEKVLQAIEEMRETLKREGRLHAHAEAAHGGNGHEAAPSSEAAYTSSLGKAVRPKTANQKAYIQAIERNDLVIAIGPAGTGKTYLSVACALAALKNGQVSKIILTRPVVEAGEKLGFLPGDFYDK